MRYRNRKSRQRAEPIANRTERKRRVSSWRSAKSRKNRSKEDHRATTFGAVGQRWNGIGSNLRLNRIVFKDGLFPGLDWDKQLLEKSQAFAACRAKESEVTYFHKTSWQDVLQETVDEFLHGKGAMFELSGIGSAILESDQGVLQAAFGERQQAAVADGDAMDVGSQVFESSLSITNWLAMHDPVFAPSPGREIGVDGSSFQGALESRAEEHGEGFHRQEEVFARGQPTSPVTAQSTTRGQVMHMGVVDQVAGPGVQYTHQPDLPTHKARVLGQLLGSLSRSAKEQVVEQFLVLAGDLAQFSGKRESQQEVRDGQEQSLLGFQPVLGLLVLALGAMAIAAGMITVAGFATGGARVNLSSQRFGAAALDGVHGLAMAGQEFGCMFLSIGRSVLAEDVSQF